MLETLRKPLRGPFSHSIAAIVAGATLLSPSPGRAQSQTRQVPVESLIFDLKNPDPVRRREAATLLGQNKVQRAAPDLVAVVGDPDASVRRAIIGALQQLPDMGTLPGFVALASDPEKDIRSRAIEGIIALYLPQENGVMVTLNKIATFFNPWSDEWGDIVIEPNLTADPAAVEVLQARLQDPEESLRIKAARALGILRGRTAIPAMLSAVRDDRSNAVRFEAVRSLLKIGEPSVAPDLMNLITYPDPKVRHQAIYTIGRMRYHAAAPELARVIAKESALPPKKIDQDYVEIVSGALAFIADPVSKEEFVRDRASTDPILRLHANEGLARLGDTAMVTEISADRLKEKDPRVRTAQAFALYRMGRKEYLSEVVNALATRRANKEAREYLVELRPAELPDLLAETGRGDANVLEGIAEVLGFAGDQSAIPTLRDLTRDSRGQISALATQAIQRISARAGSVTSKSQL